MLQDLLSLGFSYSVVKVVSSSLFDFTVLSIQPTGSGQLATLNQLSAKIRKAIFTTTFGSINHRLSNLECWNWLRDGHREPACVAHCYYPTELARDLVIYAIHMILPMQSAYLFDLSCQSISTYLACQPTVEFQGACTHSFGISQHNLCAQS